MDDNIRMEEEIDVIIKLNFRYTVSINTCYLKDLVSIFETLKAKYEDLILLYNNLKADYRNLKINQDNLNLSNNHLKVNYQLLRNDALKALISFGQRLISSLIIVLVYFYLSKLIDCYYYFV
jgi:hypothetical protein